MGEQRGNPDEIKRSARLKLRRLEGGVEAVDAEFLDNEIDGLVLYIGGPNPGTRGGLRQKAKRATKAASEIQNDDGVPLVVEEQMQKLLLGFMLLKSDVEVLAQRAVHFLPVAQRVPQHLILRMDARAQLPEPAVLTAVAMMAPDYVAERGILAKAMCLRQQDFIEIIHSSVWGVERAVLAVGSYEGAKYRSIGHA